MSNAYWFLLIGSLLLLLGLSRPLVKRIPATSAMIYLCVGLIVGPVGFQLFHFNPLREAALLEILTEVAVLISLFAAGVKMPVPFSFSRWRAPIQLAFLSMTISVGIVALFGYYVLALPLGVAVLLGAVLAPTDPVLATDVQVKHPGDNDSLRFSLTCEAGLNDGSAFPFVVLGLGLLGLENLGEFFSRWLFVKVIWATAIGFGVGIFGGYALARAVQYARQYFGRDEHLLEDFLGLGLIGAVYGVSHILGGWGFLSVFAAGVALRHTELKLLNIRYEPLNIQGDKSVDERVLDDIEKNPDITQSHNKNQEHSSSAPTPLSEASLVFKEHLERLTEVVLILLVGGMLFTSSWSYTAVGFALFLFFIVRPCSVMVGMLGTQSCWRERALISWFGVRGIGSLYYLMFAIVHGLPEGYALELIHITLVVITMSIFLHGVSVKPLLSLYYRHKNSSNAEI